MMGKDVCVGDHKVTNCCVVVPIGIHLHVCTVF